MKSMLHACILTGSREQALETRAVELAAGALCREGREGLPCRRCRHCRKVFGKIHPDVIFVGRLSDREGKLRKEITVDQIRALEADAAVLPNEADRKVYILQEAEKMNVNAQNAFLKLLEEPPDHVIFLLCAENSAMLLPTVRSRCAVEWASAEEREAEPAARERAERYLACLGKPAEQLRCCTALEKLDTAAARDFVDAVRLAAAEKLSGAALLSLERELDTAAAYLRANVGVRHVMGMLATYEMRNDLCKK